MNNLHVSDINIVPLAESAFVKPFSLKFKLNGKQKKWDLVKVHESVIIIIFNVSRQVLVMVKQFRPAVYYCNIPEEGKKDGIIDTKKYPCSLGITLEFCAGVVDKKKSLEEIACEEVFEECGYQVHVEDLLKIKTYRDGVGTEGALQTIFYVEVTDAMKIGQGGGLVEEGEVIEIVEVSIEEARAYLEAIDSVSPPGFLYGLQWFLLNKVPKGL